MSNEILNRFIHIIDLEFDRITKRMKQEKALKSPNPELLIYWSASLNTLMAIKTKQQDVFPMNKNN